MGEGEEEGGGRISRKSSHPVSRTRERKKIEMEEHKNKNKNKTIRGESEQISCYLPCTTLVLANSVFFLHFSLQLCF